MASPVGTIMTLYFRNIYILSLGFGMHRVRECGVGMVEKTLG